MKRKFAGLFWMGGCALALPLSAMAVAADAPAADGATVAAQFGALPGILDISLSPDGKRIAYVAPGAGQVTMVYTVDHTVGEEPRIVAYADGDPMRLQWCGWSGNNRLVCQQYGIIDSVGTKLPFTRLVALDADGANIKPLTQKSTMSALRISQFDGDIVDWLGGDDEVLMMRDNVPEQSIGSMLAKSDDGMSLERINTRTLRSKVVERASKRVDGYISDGRGVARIMWSDVERGQGYLTGVRSYFYRTQGSDAWKPFSTVKEGENALAPIAVDGGADIAYALQPKDGRMALYRVALDGTMKADLAYANPRVDIDDVITVGRNGRVIGAAYVTDRRAAEYFDPDYHKLGAALSKAIPNLPLVQFLGASADENILLIFAGSDVDPGRYYAFDRKARRMSELLRARPQIEGLTLSPVKSVSYAAADGTAIPAYLTLPPGKETAKGLPAIVMPHGGPASRDEWGFDWLAQFYAQRGFAVLQPNFRGSSGYGDAWFAENGFKSWKIAIGDINDGARWLISQGVADADRLAVVGWSYGGYAALQSNVVDPDLFKAVVAIAPVTDLAMLKNEARDFTNARVVADYIGSGPHIEEGSPARHADRFKAPVMLFHGDTDLNVGVAESRSMDGALRKAGKASALIVYKGLDHQLPDAAARTDMLAKSDAFLREKLKM